MIVSIYFIDTLPTTAGVSKAIYLSFDTLPTIAGVTYIKRNKNSLKLKKKKINKPRAKPWASGMVGQKTYVLVLSANLMRKYIANPPHQSHQTEN